MDKNRRAAYLVLNDVMVKGSWSNLALNEHLKEGADSPAFVRELVYGVLRNTGLLDFNINRYLKKPDIGDPERILMRMGFYQLLFMNSVPDHAAVSETVDLAASFAKGRQGFVNAVLRSFVRDEKKLRFPSLSKEVEEGKEDPRLLKHLSVKYSCAEWVVRLWLDAYGREKTEELLDASNTPAPLAIRANTIKNSRAELKEQLQQAGFEAEESGLADYSLKVKGSGLLESKLYKRGFFSVQGEASSYAAQLLAPGAGQTIMDLCAAPGGKSCALAEIMGDEGKLLAFDLYPERVKLIKASAARLGLKAVSAACADAEVLMKEYAGTADCVLADVPCSGLGTLRQKPEIKLSPEKPDLQALYASQARILENGAEYLKRGGRLVYSTCTVNPAENGHQINKFTQNHPDFKILEEHQFFTGKGGPDGFYICLLEKQ